MSRLIGLDIGFGQVKAFDGEKTVCFRSVWAKPNPESLTARHRDHVLEDAGGQKWMIGESAIQFSDNPSVPFVDSDFVREPAYQMLALKALRELGHDDVEIATGLPVRHMQRMARNMASIVEGWSHEHNQAFTLDDGRPIRVRLRSVVPQPVGTLVDVTADNSGKLMEDIEANRYLIVDIGDGTIDVIELKNGDVNAERMACFNYGASQMYFDVFCDLVSARKINDIKLAYVPRIVEQGFVVDKGAEVSLKRTIDAAKGKLARAVDVTIRQKWNDARNMSRIILTGGGAALVSAHMKKSFSEKQLSIPENPSLANARGYYKGAIGSLE